MNQRIVIGIILVFVLTVFSQCTVQKRLYRKGWNVEFHRKHSSVQENVYDAKSFGIAEPMKSDDEPALNLSEEWQGLLVLSDSAEVEVSATSKTILPAHRSIPERFSETALIHSKAPNNTVSKQKRPEDQEDKNAKVTVLSVLLLLLFCAIALMLVGLSTSTSIITSLGIVALLLITIPIALALLIALLAVLFSKTHEQLSEQKRLEAEEKKKLEGMTPDEQEAYRRENAASVSRKKTDNIAAAIIAIAIVVLAIFVLTDK